MRLNALAIIFVIAATAATAAGQCFVDPSTGIRACCMDCDDTRPTRDSGSREDRQVKPPGETPLPAVLKKIQHDKEDERALIRRLAVRAESLPAGPAAMPTRTLVVPAGETIFGNTSVSPAVELRVPRGYTPPSSIPLENLRHAAAIIRAIPAQPPTSCKNPYDPCNEEMRFLGAQAGKAVAGGEPLQVVVPEWRVADVADMSKEVVALIAQAVVAGERLDKLRKLRDPIERQLAPLKREYDAGRAPRGAEQEKLEEQYRSLVEQERNTQDELSQVQKRVAKIIVEVVP
jgi:hypothetical protein